MKPREYPHQDCVECGIPARHGDTPGPPVDALLDDDPDVYLATGPLTIENCDCDGLCECDNQ